MMDRKKELKQMYKEIPIEAGIYMITNTANQKKWVGSTRNLKSINGRKFSLEAGTDTNRALQEDWNLYGRDSFTFETLEVLKKKEDDPYFNEKEALQALEEKWKEQIQPYGEKGYNKK